MNLGVTMALCMVAIIFALALKSKNPEISGMISVAICIFLLSICIGRIRVILQGLQSLTNNIKLEGSYLVILLKLIGIAYICEFASSISKDAGYSAVASQIELLGKLTMLMVSLPVLLQVVDTVLTMMR